MILTQDEETVSIKLDFRSKIPLSDQVEDEIRRFIIGGQLKPGDPLPTVRSLASQLNVNFNTIARAYRALDQEGWIYTHQGRGTQVAERKEIPEQIFSNAQENYLQWMVSQLLDQVEQARISIHELHAEIDRQRPQDKKPRTLRMSHQFATQKRHFNRMNKNVAKERQQGEQRKKTSGRITKAPEKTRHG